MYEVFNQTPKEIIVTYIVFIAACAVTFPIINLIETAATSFRDRRKGVEQMNTGGLMAYAFGYFLGNPDVMAALITWTIIVTLSLTIFEFRKK